MEGLRIPWAEAERDALADAARMFPPFTAAQIEDFSRVLPRPLHGTDLIRELVRQKALQLQQLQQAQQQAQQQVQQAQQQLQQAQQQAQQQVQQAQQRAERAQQRAERAERRADLSLYTSLSR